jgi:hypothetical protein
MRSIYFSPPQLRVVAKMLGVISKPKDQKSQLFENGRLR